MSRGQLEQHGYPDKDVVYKFEVYTGEKDRWDSENEQSPPLAPGKAARLANAFIATVPLADNMKAWSLSTITLRRMSSAPEEWVYIVHFDAVPEADVWNGPVPWFDVPVRLNGTIPDPVIERKEP